MKLHEIVENKYYELNIDPHNLTREYKLIIKVLEKNIKKAVIRDSL